MKLRFLLSFMLGLICVNAFADTTPPRVSIFSTTVDWSAVTGLGLHQFSGEIKGRDKNFVKNGLVLYYLDSFPCYGEADSVRVWLSPNGKMSGHLRLVCVHKPETISFAWRNADEDALDSRTTGIITCPVDGNRNFTIDISKCERGKNWTEYK
ncbi:MAG: hypothetical protein IJV03_03125 [Alphaproteobacteria bacterium]|nr:hypothetical protein [Alphaproteobacteria bacterium]